MSGLKLAFYAESVFWRLQVKGLNREYAINQCDI